MRKFEQSINVTIDIDTIAEMFLQAMDKDFKHREIFVENLVGRCLLNDHAMLGQLVGACLGVKRELNHKIGDTLFVENISYDYIPEKGSHSRVSKTCKIVKIEPYADSPILVEYMQVEKDGKEKPSRSWIDLSMAKKVNE